MMHLRLCWLTPQDTEHNERAFRLDTNPAQAQNSTGHCAQSPSDDTPNILRQHSAQQTAKETTRYAHYQRVQSHALRHPELLFGIRWDVEVRHDVPQEARERRTGEDQKELIAKRTLVEERSCLTRLCEHAGAAEERGEGEQCACKSDEPHDADSPREADGDDKTVERDDIDDAP